MSQSSDGPYKSPKPTVFYDKNMGCLGVKQYALIGWNELNGVSVYVGLIETSSEGRRKAHINHVSKEDMHSPQLNYLMGQAGTGPYASPCMYESAHGTQTFSPLGNVL